MRNIISPVVFIGVLSFHSLLWCDSAQAQPPQSGGTTRPLLRIPATYKFQDGQFALADSFKLSLPGRRPITVPRGFVTDYASIPPVARSLVRGQHDLPALVHDYLYWRQCPQELADDLFLDALEELGLPRWKRGLMYMAVHAFGAIALRENQQERSRGLPRIIPANYLPPPPGDWREFRKELRRGSVSLDRLDRLPPKDCP